jgi:hypothetical protein
MNLNELSVPLYLGFLYLSVFPLGYLLLDFKGFKQFHAFPFSVKLSIYLALGLISSSVIYYFIGLLMLHVIIPILLFTLSLFLLIIKKRDVISKLKKFDFSKLSTLGWNTYVPIILWIITFLYFSYTAGYLRWPIPSDALVHGRYTSNVIYDGKVTSVSYPLGFHTVAANIALSLTLYPGEANFLLGTAILALIPLVLYSLTYVNTGSKTLSVMTYFSAFLIHSSQLVPFERWLIGSFYAGVYPSLFGFLALFTFCAFISIEDTSQNKGSGFTYIFPMVLISLFLSFTYPSFFGFILIYFIYKVLLTSKMLVRRIRSMSQCEKMVTAGLLFVTFLLFAYTLVIQINRISWVFNWIANPNPTLMLPTNYFHDWRVSLLLFGGAFTALFLLLKHVHSNISLFYLVMFVPIILSLNEELYRYVTFLLPLRSVLMLTSLSWVILSSLFHEMKGRSACSGSRSLSKTDQRSKINYLILCVMLIFGISFFAPSLSTHCSLELLTSPHVRYFVKQSGFRSDFQTLQWIDNNIPPQDVILNDFSFSSFFLLSFSYRNITTYYRSNGESNRDAFQVWKNPHDSDLLRRTIDKYAVTHVYVTAETYFFDYLDRATAEYRQKFYTPSEYIHIFNTYRFLTPIFMNGESVIYRVSE